jgi:DNA-directed RNA polymerase subunit alpha
MTKPQNLFVSCVESRIQNNGSLYARFHLGTFFRGQALTFANPLRRILLSEIPGLIMTNVSIQGASHEFATLPGVEETILEILLNLKKIIFAPSTSKIKSLVDFKATGYLKIKGPGKVSAGQITLPTTVKCINPETHIATLTTGRELVLCFDLQLVSPHQWSSEQRPSPLLPKKPAIGLDNVPMPIQKVNYAIKSMNAKHGSEYLILEVWTDGSISPQESVHFALRNVTKLFFQFARLSQHFQ